MMIEKGDVIFMVDLLEKNISELSKGYGGYSYSHCGIYIGDGSIVEAVKDQGVIVSKLESSLGNKNLVCRTNSSPTFINDMIEHANSFKGFDYNELFLPNQDAKLYCSELVHKAFSLANNGEFFKTQKLNYISPNESEVSQYWVEFYKKLLMKPNTTSFITY